MSAEELQVEKLGVDLTSGELPNRLKGELSDPEVEKVNTEFSRTDRELVGKAIVAEVERKRLEDAMNDAILEGNNRKYEKLRDKLYAIGSPEFKSDMNQRAASEFAGTHSDQLQSKAKKEMDDHIFRKSHPSL